MKTALDLCTKSKKNYTNCSKLCSQSNISKTWIGLSTVKCLEFLGSYFHDYRQPIDNMPSRSLFRFCSHVKIFCAACSEKRKALVKYWLVLSIV